MTKMKDSAQHPHITAGMISRFTDGEFRILTKAESEKMSKEEVMLLANLEAEEVEDSETEVHET